MGETAVDEHESKQNPADDENDVHDVFLSDSEKRFDHCAKRRRPPYTYLIAYATISLAIVILIPMAPKWLSPDEMSAWRSFIETSGDLLRAIEKDLQKYGLDLGDYQLLAMLSEAPDGQLRLCDLADSLRLTRSGLTRRMDGVESKKLVARVQSDQDRRVTYASMTAKGHDTLRKIAPLHLITVRELMIDLLSPAEIKAMASAFAKISDNLARRASPVNAAN